MKKINLSKFKITNKGLYIGLIVTFFVIYICVGFVSTLHAITFFQMANSVGLAILLALAFEIGQSSVLFSILMTKNKEKFLPWLLMILLTALQITGNVFASFKHIMTSGNLDWQYFQQSILFGVQAANPEMYQVIISWLQGALLPVVALGLTALVAQNINLLLPREDESSKVGSVPDEEVDNIINNEVEKKVEEILKPSSSYIPLDQIQPLTDKDNESKDDDDFGPLLIDEKEKDYLDEQVNSLMPLVENNEVSMLPEKKDVKKRGRKQKQTSKPKKEQGRLQKEESVNVPKKEQNEPLISKNIKELFEKTNNDITKESIIEPLKDEEISHDSILVPPELRTPYIDSGVEVIDAKAVTKPEIKKNST